ncbi:hypothetical protein C8Q80DRAFT_1180224 [Daedaleopsis nitida]|nr:hypothetical protein C8Q80DRAFT_1180224 [Daedaleopsis nitida]
MRIDHHIARGRFREQVSLGGLTGLTKTGIYLFRLPPGVTSMALHWHENSDEWMYILDVGEGAVLLVWERGDEKSREEIVPKEVAVQNGDFIGFPLGVERAHALKAGSKELVYLVGSDQGSADVCHYSMEGKRTDYTVDEATGKIVGATRDEDIFKPST